MNNPLISIILPTYNRAETLPRAIDSVLSQTFQDFELIIVDDTSTDNTRSLLEKYRQQDSRILIIYCETQNGAAKARNIGIKKARGNYIAFQDSDDEWLPHKLEDQYNALNTLPQEYGFIFSTYKKINKNSSVIAPKRLLKINTENLFLPILEKNLVGTPTALIRKSCLEKIGCFNELLPALEDWEFFTRLSRHFKGKYSKEPLVNVYTAPKNRLSSNFKKILDARIKIYRIYHSEIKKHPLIYFRHILKISLFSVIRLFLKY